MKDKYYLPTPSIQDVPNRFNTPYVVFINTKGTLSSAPKDLNCHIGCTVLFEGKNFEEANVFISNYQPPATSPE